MENKDILIGQEFIQHCGDILIVKNSIRKEKNRLYYICEFKNHPYKVVCEKRAFLKGEVYNPQIELDEFVGKEFKQNCGDILKVLRKSEQKQGNIALFECEFLKYPYKILARKHHILEGGVNNPEIINQTFIGKTFKQRCGDSIKVIEQVEERGWDKGHLYKCYFLNNPEKIFLAERGHILKGEYANYELRNDKYPWKWKDTLERYILEKFPNKKPTLTELSEKLGITNSTISRYIIDFGLRDLVEYFSTQSFLEIKLNDYINSLGIKTEQSKWGIIKDREIDIYILDKKLGFEFNGNLWHSNHEKWGKEDNEYHQKKSLAAKEQGIRLIHIWEWEWNERNKLIKGYIKNQLGIFNKIIYARRCVIKELEYKEYAAFCNENHLQRECAARVKLGLYYNNELIQIMSFGSPRFNCEYEWEIIRECSKLGCCVVGGKKKLWKYFLRKYYPNSVISYCDFSKFNGNSYLKLGFEKERLNKPGFVWWNESKNEVYWRNPYKHQELKKYWKIFDAGQLVFVWKANN